MDCLSLTKKSPFIWIIWLQYWLTMAGLLQFTNHGTREPKDMDPSCRYFMTIISDPERSSDENHFLFLYFVNFVCQCTTHMYGILWREFVNNHLNSLILISPCIYLNFLVIPVPILRSIFEECLCYCFILMIYRRTQSKKCSVLFRQAEIWIFLGRWI